MPASAFVMSLLYYAPAISDEKQKQTNNNLPILIYTKEAAVAFHKPTAVHQSSWYETRRHI